jgi:hypothetical protein
MEKKCKTTEERGSAERGVSFLHAKKGRKEGRKERKSFASKWVK